MAKKTTTKKIEKRQNEIKIQNHWQNMQIFFVVF